MGCIREFAPGKDLMVLLAGYAKREITPELGAPLAGRPGFIQRRAHRVRDSLFVRGLYVESEHTSFACVSCDILLTTRALQLAVAHAAHIDPAALLLCATHTHSSIGGYWRGRRLETFMGPYDSDAYEALVSAIAQVVSESRSRIARADVRAAKTVVDAGNVNRRTSGGATDPTLNTLLFEVHDAAPICLIAYGAHPVGVLEHQPHSASADYPGEICKRLELQGTRPLFLLGAAAGTSPQWLDLDLESHLERMAQALDDAYRSSQLTPVRAELRVTVEEIATATADCHVFPSGFPGGQALEWASGTLRRAIDKMFREGQQENRGLLLHHVRLGDVTILGLPFEIGPALGLALQSAAIEAGARIPIVVSMCNGYAGYAHMPSDYTYPGFRRLRPLTIYENAMSAAGWQVGDEILRSVRKSLRAGLD